MLRRSKRRRFVAKISNGIAPRVKNSRNWYSGEGRKHCPKQIVRGHVNFASSCGNRDKTRASRSHDCSPKSSEPGCRRYGKTAVRIASGSDRKGPHQGGYLVVFFFSS